MTTADSPRPTQSLPQVLLDSMDDIVAKLMSRLDGIDDVEYRWEPVANMWSARATNDEGSEAIIDLDPDRDIDPAPVTTIAWRLWHLTSDCFADYTARFAGETAVPDDLSWTLRADEALDRFEASWRKFRAALVGFDDWFDELGADFGPWHRHCIADFAMHASNERVHHAAEIALLRDLYQMRSSEPLGSGAPIVATSHNIHSRRS